MTSIAVRTCRNVPVFLAGLWLSASSSIGLGQGPELPLAVARHLFVEPEPKTFDLDQELRFQVDRTVLVDLGGTQHLRPRLFRGSRAELISGGLRAPGSCRTYMGNQVRAELEGADLRFYWPGSRDSIRVDSYWLDPSSAEAPLRSRYVLVLEKAGGPTAELRLKEESVRSYFLAGIEFQIEPSVEVGPSRWRELALRLEAQQSEVRGRLLATASVSLVCFIVPDADTPVPGVVALLAASDCLDESSVAFDRLAAAAAQTLLPDTVRAATTCALHPGDTMSLAALGEGPTPDSP